MDVCHHLCFLWHDECAGTNVEGCRPSNAVMDKVEEAVKNGIVGNEDDNW